MWILLLSVIGCLAAWVLLRRNKLPHADAPYRGGKVSVIIPARNEAHNLPYLLNSLKNQSRRPDEIIVVDDGSEDRTREVAESYGVKVVQNETLPAGWTGKTWAVWNGFLKSTGDLLIFLDADIRLSSEALNALLHARSQNGGVISAVPFHYTEKLYERLALVPNILGLFAFMSPFERRNPQQGLYGSCIVATRKDYESINGHDGIRSEVLDDLNLGAKFREAGIPVTNYLGGRDVSFRMYPEGLRSELEGFSKGAVTSTSKLSPLTVTLIAVWFVTLIAAQSAWFLWPTSWAWPAVGAYLLFTAQIFLLTRYVGRFGWLMPLLHTLSVLFFLVAFIYSAYQVVFLKKVVWKGRTIDVGGRKSS
ncbi:glycosyl transferase family 2 [Paenibacillus yonginensis]|uniref:4,4'-diaponeurosporenoate glycosyltransferase n=1 Tax=Paenibacillus yonginensis TaxID=1462996 RepID=A0A1B1N391_9BACL|nr:glycosyltransferase [Paenibacillus yonginensis]ANS75903.1 glycosyl transferase family 2 [Paenibacillus yonginensis]